MSRPGKPPYRGPKRPPREDVPSPHEHAPRLVTGMQPVREAIRAHGSALGSVIVERATGEAAGRLDALARFAEAQGVSQVERAPRSTLDRLAAGALHQGAVAWAPALRIHESAEVLAGESFLILALDGVQDPQNFGAAIRSAVALGATAIVWAEHSSAPLTPATFRASAGAIEHATLCRVPSLVRFLDDALGQGARVIGLAADGTVALHREDLRGSTVLVVGSEHEGLARAVRKRCTSVARLTLRGPVESLNASVAAAIAVHLAQIQRENSGS